MSDIFFEELSIPKPEYNLGIGSETHAKQTAKMMIGIEDILLKEKPINIDEDKKQSYYGVGDASEKISTIISKELNK